MWYQIVPLNYFSKRFISELFITKIWVRLIENNSILCVDCIEGMSKLDDNSVELAVTSPPYNINKDYGDYKDNMQWIDFMFWNEKVLKEMVRVSKKNVYVIGTHNNMEFYSRLRILLERNHWFYQVIFCPRYLYTNPVELAIFISKEDFKRSHKPPVMLNNALISWIPVKYGKVENLYKGHPASFPERISNYFIQSFTEKGDLVMDPFMGAGTTALSAKRLGRDYIGFEINEKYVALANERLKKVGTLVSWF